MKKAIVILLTLCLCVSLCACGSEITNEEMPSTEPTATEPPPYEDTLIEKLKIGDPQSKVTEVFGKAQSDDGNGEFAYNYVYIFNELFEPCVEIEDGCVESYSYESISDNQAKAKVTYRKLIDNFTRLYGNPYESDEESDVQSCTWYFEDGTQLLVTGRYYTMNFVKISYYYY